MSESQFERVAHYIQNQHEHHRKTSFEDELIALLKAGGLPYHSESPMDLSMGLRSS